MKHRFLITITDTESFRQFTLNQIFKWIVGVVAFGIVAAGVATWFYMKWLEDAYDEAKLRQKVLERNIATLEKSVEGLNLQIDDFRSSPTASPCRWKASPALSDGENIRSERPGSSIRASTCGRNGANRSGPRPTAWWSMPATTNAADTAISSSSTTVSASKPTTVT